MSSESGIVNSLKIMNYEINPINPTRNPNHCRRAYTVRLADYRRVRGTARPDIQCNYEQKRI
jgi:hypothetical protein